MADSFRGPLAKFRDATTLEERKRWRPLYLLMKREERRLKAARTGLRDRDARAAAVAQYELIQELLTVAPRQARKRS